VDLLAPGDAVRHGKLARRPDTDHDADYSQHV
jgi:hypothetical protein